MAKNDSLLDRLITTGTVFDWITPVATFAQDYYNRPAVGYNVPVACGWSAYAIRNLLTSKGIKLWGLTIYGDLILFRVRKAQARWAQQLMAQAGIPYQGGVRK